MCDGRLKEVFTEMCVLQKFDHPGIVRYHKFFKSNPANPKFHLLVEFCPGGSLQTVLERQSTLIKE